METETISIEQKRKDWLDTHLQVYLNNPKKRSKNEMGTICRYRGFNGTKCIIGQDIPDEKYTNELEGDIVDNRLILSVLPQSTLDLGTQFLLACQSLHDDNDYWSETGLSAFGIGQYNYIVTKYCTI